MARRAVTTTANDSYLFTKSNCIAPSLLSKYQFMERGTSATHLPVAGEWHHLQAMYLEATDQGPLFTPPTDDDARTISPPPLTAGSEAAPVSLIMGLRCSGELMSPRRSSDTEIRTQARQAAYEFSRGDEDLEIMFELNSDMGITLRHPFQGNLAGPPPSAGRRWLKRGAEEAPEGDMVDSSTIEPSSGDDWVPTGMDMGQAPTFWHGGDGRFASDASGGNAVRTVELLGARLQKDARQQLELTESCVPFGPGSAV